MSVILAALAGLLAGAALAWFFLRSAGAAASAAAAERLLAREADIARLSAGLAARETELAESRRAVEAERAAHALTSSSLAAEQAAAVEKIAALTDAHTRLSAEFKALSADALRANNEAFLNLARETLGRTQQAAAGELEKRQLAIDALVKPIRESLEKVDAKITAFDQSRATTAAALAQQLATLSTAQAGLQTETARLSTALRSTTTAGTWGEIQLRRVVELAGMTAYCDFSEQTSVTAGDTRLRPDMVVRLPGGQSIVVDAKAPNEAYRDAASAPDEATRAARLADHAAKVRGHVDALGAKAYWEQFQPAPEFVVLFLPGDQFLAGALQADPELLERAILKKVLLTTPATLIALLKAAHYGWRQETASRNAEEIAQQARELYDRVCVFTDHFVKVGSALDSATKSYNQAVSSFEGRILPAGRRLEELGAKGAKDLAAAVPALELSPRELTKRA
jgi:DNA recombination protein RmuC